MPENSNDRFMDATTTSWGSRIGQSIAGLFIGILLVLAAIILIYWNEGRAVEAISALNQGLRQVIDADPARVLSSNDGKLVHVSGTITTATPARDPAFAVTGDGLLRLRRNIQMYQWKESASTSKSDSLGGSETTVTTYSYNRVWSGSAINSGSFHHPLGHINPVMPMRSVTFDTSVAMLGVYHVDPGVLDETSDFTPFAVANPPKPPSSPSFYSATGYKAEDGDFYRGQDPANPAIGDLRISFEAIRSQVFSVVAAQIGNALTPYHAPSGYEIALIKPGALTAATLFSEKRQEERVLTWVLRGIGFVLMVIAFAMLAAPLATLFAVVPFLGNLVEAGLFIVALTFAVPATLITIAVAWAAHRPLIGGALFAAALVSLILLSRLHRPKPALAKHASAPLSS